MERHVAGTGKHWAQIGVSRIWASASSKRGAQSFSHKKQNSVHTRMILKRTLNSRWEWALVTVLISARWDPEQRTSWAQPGLLTHKDCEGVDVLVIFYSSSELVVTCYSSKENEYIHSRETELGKILNNFIVTNPRESSPCLFYLTSFKHVRSVSIGFGFQDLILAPTFHSEAGTDCLAFFF